MALPHSSSLPAKCLGSAKPRLPVWKRALDLGFCVLTLPFLASVTFVLAVLMSIASPGPIFFRQERVGYLGRRFRIFKFRTMHVGADTKGHQAHFAQLVAAKTPMQKLDVTGDKRLIALGWLIRAIGIDELPQIINIWTGDMSLIGPRPCIPYEYESYSSAQRKRFNAVPGLTGLWQVSGKNRTTFERMIELDVQYASQCSLGMDAKILLLTPVAIGAQVLHIVRARLGKSAEPMMEAPKAPLESLELK